MNNLLSSHISEEENNNVSEGDVGSNFLNSFENENNYFDKNQIFMNNNNPRDSELSKKVHHMPRESPKRIRSLLYLNNLQKKRPKT